MDHLDHIVAANLDEEKLQALPAGYEIITSGRVEAGDLTWRRFTAVWWPAHPSYYGDLIRNHGVARRKQ